MDESQNQSDEYISQNESLNNNDFSLDDLESLQDANIDNELLESCFINSHIKAFQSKFDKIARHSKTFGYVKLTEKALRDKKKRLFKSWDESFLTKLKTLDQRVLEHGERIKDLEKVQWQGNLTTQMLLRMERSKMVALKNQKQRLIREQKHCTYAEILKNPDDHENFDLMYSENFYKALEKSQTPRKASSLKISKSQVQESCQDLNVLEKQEQVVASHQSLIQMDSNNQVLTKSMVQAQYTLRQDTMLYYYWSMFIALNCLYSSLYYPFYTLNHFPEPWSQAFLILWVSELFFLVDIILGFLTQQLNEEGKSKLEPLEEVSRNYLKSTDFKVALITLIPWGLFFTLIDEKLKFFWAIKATRIIKLNSHFSDRQMLPLIQFWIHSKQQKYLNDPILRTNKETDQTFVKDKIYITNIMRIVRLILQILFVCFFFGQYWYIFSQTAHLIKFSESENEFESETGIEESSIEMTDEFQSWVEYYGNWGLKEMSKLDKVLTSTYFACTSLSTVGFGDYYPVSDVERLVGSFYMLFGVAIFSYFMGELTEMMIKYNRLDNEVEEEEDLDQFFGVIKMFNFDNNLDQELTARIRAFMRFKWKNDKNYFLADQADFKNFYSQLPTKCQLMLYTDFIFYEFLFKFRRFFSFRIVEPRPQDTQYDAGTFRSRGSINTVGSKVKYSAALQKLRKKISMMISLCSAMRNKDYKELRPMSRREVFAMTQRFRERVRVMDEKTRVIDLQKKIEKIEQEGKISYEYKKNIKYPFLTFEDDKYSRFMTLIMQNLEVRQYQAGKFIARELDECLEVLFVVSGRYKVGYELNNVERYRKQFGPCTMIGGFLVSFQKRFNFLYKAHTDMMCYAIRKKQWLQIMNQFPRFFLIIKQKSLAFHFCKILRPLLQMKNDEIEFFDRRKDFNQILATSHLQTKNIKEALFKLYSDSDDVDRANQQRLYTQDQICWLISTIQTKLAKVANIAVGVTQKSEKMQRLFWGQIIDGITFGQITNYPEQLHAELYDTIVPYEDQLRINLFESEDDNKKMINLIHRLWSIQNGRCKLSDNESHLKPYIIAEFKKRLASKLSDYSSQISLNVSSSKKTLHEDRSIRAKVPAIFSGQFDNFVSKFNPGQNSGRGQPKNSKRERQGSRRNKGKMSQTRPDIPSINTNFQALDHPDSFEQLLSNQPIDAGFQDLRNNSSQFQLNTHRIDASAHTMQSTKMKQNTFRQQPMQSSRMNNKPEPTVITAGQFMPSDGGMTTIQSQAPVQFFERFRTNTNQKRQALQQEEEEEEEKIEEGLLMGRVKEKQNDADDVNYGSEDGEEQQKLACVLGSIQDVPEQFLDITQPDHSNNGTEQRTELNQIDSSTLRQRRRNFTFVEKHNE